MLLLHARLDIAFLCNVFVKSQHSSFKLEWISNFSARPSQKLQDDACFQIKLSEKPGFRYFLELYLLIKQI